MALLSIPSYHFRIWPSNQCEKGPFLAFRDFSRSLKTFCPREPFSYYCYPDLCSFSVISASFFSPLLFSFSIPQNMTWKEKLSSHCKTALRIKKDHISSKMFESWSFFVAKEQSIKLTFLEFYKSQILSSAFLTLLTVHKCIPKHWGFLQDKSKKAKTEPKRPNLK